MDTSTAPSAVVNLTKQHPDFEAQAPKYAKWNDLYMGGDFVEKGGYLVRHPFETERQFATRKARSAYKNYAAPIVGVFSASVWRKKPERKLAARLEELTDNVDRLSTPVDAFFYNITRMSAAIGARFVLVDMPQAPEGRKTSVEEDKALGRRPYFVDIDARDVIDWGVKDGALQWAVIHSIVETENTPFGNRKEVDRYTLWTRDSWEVYDAGEDGSGSVLVESGVNPLGEVPLVGFFFERDRFFIGNSAIDDVASLCLRVYMRDSERDMSLFNSALAILFAKGFSEEDLTFFLASSSNGIRSSSTDADLKYVEPEGRSFSAVREAILDDERTIREVALRQVRPDSKQIESADAKRIDNGQLNSQLARFSNEMSRGEAKCWELAARWMGIRNAEIEVAYNDDFDEDVISGDLLRAFTELRRSGDLSRETLFGLLKEWEVLPPDFDPEEESAKLENEARQGQTAVGIGTDLTGFQSLLLGNQAGQAGEGP